MSAIDDRDDTFFSSKPILSTVPPARTPTKMTAAELSSHEFNPVKFIVPTLIPKGLTLLSAAPKIGKSWMVLHIGESVSGGRKVFGEFQCEKGAVLYLALEDNLARMKDRLDKIGALPEPNFTIETDRIRGQAGLEYIKRWLDNSPDAALVIIDTLGRFRDDAKKGQQLYDADIAALAPLHNLASQREIAIIVVHHTRKQGADDVGDMASGSRGLTGTADTSLTLIRQRGNPDGILHIFGRDVEEQEVALRFEQQSGLWFLSHKTPAMIEAGEAQTQVIDLFSTLPDLSQSLPLALIAKAINKNKSTTAEMLKRMKEKGIVEQIGGRGGNYRLRPQTLFREQDTNQLGDC